MDELQAADPRARRLAVIVMALGVGAALVLITFADTRGGDVMRWVTADPRQVDARVRLLMWVVGILTCAPPLVFAAYLWRLGTRVSPLTAFPPPGPRCSPTPWCFTVRTPVAAAASCRG
jgi:hypothetical protein